MRRMRLILAAVAVMAAIMALSLSTAAFADNACHGRDCSVGKLVKVNTGIATGGTASGDNSGGSVGGTDTNGGGVTNNPNYKPCTITVNGCT